MAINFYQGNSDYFSIHQTGTDDKLEIIKNRISEFFNMKNVHFLFGSGTSCPAIPNMKDLFDKVKKAIDTKVDSGNKEIKIDNEISVSEKERKEFDEIASKSQNNLEEILGVLYSKREYLRGSIENIEDSEDYKDCDSIISLVEETIFREINVFSSNNNETTEKNLKDVLSIYKKFYQMIALRNKDLSRINVFTTNNDLFNETALDSLNIHYINGFNGGISKYFNPAMFNYTYSKRMDTSIDRFEPVENMVYLYKIHGSINWIEDINNANSYFDIKETTCPNYDKEKSILIYPTPMKQNKSLGSPYSDLFREFQHKLLEPNSVLFVIGYSFSDEHVNDIIYRALATNTTFNLVIINEINKEKAICKVNDNRVFRIWEDGTEKPLHYFERIVKDLLPNLDASKQKDILTEFVMQIKGEKQKLTPRNNENR